jgi:hypothetical protein
VFAPFEICKSHNILIISEPLGTIAGYYENKTIHLNENVPKNQWEYLVCYLLYFYFFEPNNIAFTCTGNQKARKFAIYMQTQKIEQMANAMHT